jgi:hypothetical protein
LKSGISHVKGLAGVSREKGSGGLAAKYTHGTFYLTYRIQVKNYPASYLRVSEYLVLLKFRLLSFFYILASSGTAWKARSGQHDLKQGQSGGFHSFKVYRDTA